MISWWWLVVEAVVFATFGVMNRGAARSVGLLNALNDPDKARAELKRRKDAMTPIFWVNFAQGVDCGVFILLGYILGAEHLSPWLIFSLTMLWALVGGIALRRFEERMGVVYPGATP